MPRQEMGTENLRRMNQNVLFCLLVMVTMFVSGGVSYIIFDSDPAAILGGVVGIPLGILFYTIYFNVRRKISGHR